MSSAYERVIDALRANGSRVEDRGRDDAMAQCPAHEDRNPSLHVQVGHTGDRVVLHCFAGCDDTDVLTELGLSVRDLFDEHATYQYAGGAVAHRRPGKQFSQSGNMADRSLFRVEKLPEDTSIQVLVVEGEKDANTAAYLDGVAAVSPRQGAATPPERYDWSPLKGRPAVIVADNDEAGIAHAHRVADLLENVAASVSIVRAAEGKDFTDHIQNGHTVDELVPIEEPNDADPFGHIIDWTALLDGEAEPVDWLIPDVIAKGRSYALAASAKAGKSLLMLDLLIQHRVKVLYLDNEQTEQDLRSRVLAMGATAEDLVGRLSYRLYPNLAPLDTPAGGQQLFALVDTHKPDLVVLDTVSRFVNGDENDSATYQAFYRHSLLALKRTGVAVLRLDHLGKDATKGQRGSSAKNDDVDCVWLLVEKLAGETYSLRCERQRSGDHPQHIEITRQRNPLRHSLTADYGLLNVEPSDPVLAVIADLDRLEIPVDWGRDRVRRRYTKKCRNEVLAEAINRRREQAENTCPRPPGQVTSPAAVPTTGTGQRETADQTCPGQVGDRVGDVLQATCPPMSPPLGGDRSAGTGICTCSECQFPMTFESDIELGHHAGCAS
ncbi:AAA family ATPase [Gordonia sp. C13]|uniref:AAA family ATPase n=1 Tax=Gordonia sp. C13 TaxID=2935078 RepID=UPI00200AF8B5|nr:AAA family ATPase [Gordonia sp. C13]MCK8615852.1 AAA family ATPase [Gordonia sp. C13]